MKTKKQIGFEVEFPKEKCEDNNCPFHGTLKVRGRTFSGKVISKDVHKSATVEWDRLIKIKKYERTEKKKSKVSAHNPPCIDAQKGDYVMIAETRPISKTKKFVILNIIKKNESN
ncbi:30S ribosomal protein S17 [archaeon]|nr:30S ribosomal protein S17 [archaeon]